MLTNQISPFDVAKTIIIWLILVTTLYAAWVNLFQKRVSKIGFDAFILFIVSLFDKKQMQKIRKDPALIKRLGYMMLLMGVGAVWTLITE